MTTQAKKITISTLRSFAKKNAAALFIKNMSSFDGMTDCVQACDGREFRAATNLDLTETHTWGIGAWFVGRSRDYFQPYNRNGFTGIEVTNCCGNFVIAVKEWVPASTELVMAIKDAA